MAEYELLICESCGREKVRPTTMRHVVKCVCGSDEFALYDLVPVARDIEERYQLREEVRDAAVTA